MEVIAKVKTSCSSGPTAGSSSFDCDPSAMDSLLGVGSKNGIKLRIDMPEAPARQESRDTKESRLGQPSHTESRLGQPCYTDQLLRLLDRQQAWYDAQQQAARAAEQLLSLCEHHQQQWLQPNPQTQPASPVSQS